MLNWTEIRIRAASFAREFRDARYEKGETQTFYNEFFKIFGKKRRSVAKYEERVKKLNDQHGFIDLFWPGTLLVEQKSAGRSLEKAIEQAMDYCEPLDEVRMPRFVLACDFQNFCLIDLDERTQVDFALEQLPQYIEHFGFITGRTKRRYDFQDPVSIAAAEQMGQLHDAIKASGYTGHDLELLLVRLVFCMFAEDTGIFEPKGLFQEIIEYRTSVDGIDVGMWLNMIFQTLNTPVSKRQDTTDEDLAQLPYVNGQLFEHQIKIVSFDSKMRHMLIEACEFSWESVSPAIFGALFQSVMDVNEQREKGAHYTTEQNILKVINSLYMDDLRAEFNHLRALKREKEARLKAFQSKLGNIHVLDPACGCGNFLVVAYRVLRELELKVLIELQQGGQRNLDATMLSVVNVDQFYGIEYEEFASRIAQISMWMMDHLMNVDLGMQLGLIYSRIPLTHAPTIKHGNALREDWTTILEPGTGRYIIGNPPFVGKSNQNLEQKSDMKHVFGTKYKSLDYVAAWYKLAAKWLDADEGNQAKVGLVSTNSITQGEQVDLLWSKLLFEHHLHILFAHQTFVWSSDVRGEAKVHCVIIGLAKTPTSSPLLYESIHQTQLLGDISYRKVSNISPYLREEESIIVKPRTKPLCDVSPMKYGSKPADGGGLLLTEAEYNAVVAQYPGIKQFIRRMVGSTDYLNSQKRYCYWLVDANPSEYRKYLPILEALDVVKESRLKSNKSQTKEAASTPYLFAEIRQPETSYIIIPRHSSQERIWLPFAFFDKDVIVNDACSCVPDASLYEFGVISSSMHLDWMRAVAGRIKSDYRYSSKLVYNTFIWPESSDKQRAKIEQAAQDVIDVRVEYVERKNTLDALYDAELMPSALRKAHKTLDRAVERAYSSKKFDTQQQRIMYLLKLYQQATSN